MSMTEDIEIRSDDDDMFCSDVFGKPCLVIPRDVLCLRNLDDFAVKVIEEIFHAGLQLVRYRWRCASQRKKLPTGSVYLVQ